MKADQDTINLLALAAYKHGEISEGRCVEITGMKREEIRDEMHKRCGRFQPYNEALAEAELWKNRYESLPTTEEAAHRYASTIIAAAWRINDPAAACERVAKELLAMFRSIE